MQAGAATIGLGPRGVAAFAAEVPFQFEFRRYRLPFRTPVRTAHGWWREREGVLVRLEDEFGRCGWGEAAPIPWFGTETVDEVEAACRELGAGVDEARLAAVPKRLRCLRHALSAAGKTEPGERRYEAGESGTVESGRTEPAGSDVGVAALVPAGRGAPAAIAARAEAGFRVFKWKVGTGDVADELVLFDDVCAALPEGGTLRLDANGAWDRRQAERWLERCADRPVEFVEQPCGAGVAESVAQRQRSDDLLRGLAGDFPTPIALDESLVSDGDVERWLGAGWRGVFVVKPALFADADQALERLATAKAAVVFSSALETAVGARATLLRALDWPGERRAVGFGVWPLFSDTRCDGPAAAPFLRRAEVMRIEPEVVWNALR